jgi:hypothetical protein
MYRTVQQQAEVYAEAERRVRAGESRAEVARSLDIPLSTIASWAHKGGWRRKDIVAVRNAAQGEMVLGLINQLTAKEHEQRKTETAKLREALDASKAELAATVQAVSLSAVMGEGPVPAHKLAMMMADSLLRQGQLEEADRAIRLAARFGEAEHAANSREETKWKEERERTLKLWTEKQTAYHKLHVAAEHALAEIETSLTQELTRSADHCCPKCGRRMDFWPKEIERPDDDDDDSGGGDSGKVESGLAQSDPAQSEKPQPEKVQSGPAQTGKVESDDDDDDFSNRDSIDSGAGRSGGESIASEPAAEMDLGCHPHWKKDANGSWYWDGPPG